MPCRPRLSALFRQIWRYLQKLRHLYLVAVIIWYIAYGWKSFLTADFIFAFFLPVFFLYGRGIDYLKRFLPFVALIIVYDSLRSLVPIFVHKVHFHEMIAFDHWLTGTNIPTVLLQQAWYHGSLHWFDYYFYFLYMLHFVAPFAIALLIWRFRPDGYWRFVTALLVLSYAGFITYLLYPAAPPWMASDDGLIPTITKISTAVWFGWGIHDIPNIYAHLNPNPTAAVPSLHSAYPTLDWLFVNRLFPLKISLPFLIYPLSIYIGVVYMGEHYVFDVILGLIFALTAFYGTEWVFSRIRKRRRRTQPIAGKTELST